ncbi:MAG: glycosyltransferase family 4 protein [Gemmataceae bacterium]
MTPRPARVVFLNPAGQLGGGERGLVEVVRAVGDHFPLAVRHVLLGEDGPVRPLLEAAGASVHVIPLPAEVRRLGDSGGRPATLDLLAAGPPAVRYLRHLRRTLATLQPTLVHSNGIKTHVLSVLAAPAGVPVVWHVRDFLGGRPVVRAAARWLAPRVRAVIANSHAVAADARRVLGRVPVVPILNAVDPEQFHPGPTDAPLDEWAGLSPPEPGAVRVGLVATYARWKGQDVFLEALARLPAGVSVRGYVVGGPIYQSAGSQFTRDELVQRAKALGLAGRVGFVPFQPGPAAVYRALDVVVHASTRPEPFGRTVAEAMSCGRAVIATTAGGVTELFADGVDAVGVRPNDPAALAGAIGRLATDAALRARLGSAARGSAGGRFTPARFGGELAAVYREIGLA